MKSLNTISVVLGLGALAVSRLTAQDENLKIETTYIPQLSPGMLMEGVTEGRAIFVLDVSAEGELTDMLALAYTHPSLVRTCSNALKEWKFTPPRRDGVPMAVQTELTINFSAEGVVVSRNMQIELEQYIRNVFGHRLSMKRRAASELDAVPAVVAKVSPKYAKQAEQEGVRGKVTVHFYIDETGAVRMPAVEGEAHPYLAQQAVAALREWRFTPPTARGKPVMVSARQDFEFSK
jgi:TonB family protein